VRTRGVGMRDAVVEQILGYMEKGFQHSQGARPVNQDIQSMWWTRTSRLSMKNSVSLWWSTAGKDRWHRRPGFRCRLSRAPHCRSCPST
jgi:hypothetical protein